MSSEERPKTDTEKPSSGDKRREREERSARALRENLKRRKAQLKAREDNAEDNSEDATEKA